MLDRRTLFGATAAVSSMLASAVGGRKAQAKIPESVDFEPRGQVGILERLPTLDLESNDDFLMAFRTFVNQDVNRAATIRAHRILEENGHDPREPMNREDAVKLLADDPIVGTRFRTWTSAQQLMWRNLKREFDKNADKYLSEMEATDNVGPGTLELNPGIEPEYTKHEIHMQPGGYVGDRFAGHIYHYGTNNFHMGRNDQNEHKIRRAEMVPLPEDGKVARVLEQGCSIGQTTIALKQRFSDAEVWGIDVGGPMVRYGHMRAVEQGIDINLAQRLAEDSKFPDNHFDIVMSNILHHEVSAEASRKIIQEAFRVLRPGGVYFPIDFFTAVDKVPEGGWEQARWWWTHRWNQEVWYYDYAGLDFAGEMKKAGFTLTNGPAMSDYGDRRNLTGVKPA